MTDVRKGRKLVEISINQVIDTMKKKGFRITQQRVNLIKLLLKGKGHFSAEEIYNLAKSKGIGLSTVYRTLKALKEIGIISERNFGDGRIRYEVELGHHDHLICTECGKVVEFYNEQIEKIQNEIAEKFGFTLEGHRHELWGTCPECRRKKR